MCYKYFIYHFVPLLLLYHSQWRLVVWIWYNLGQWVKISAQNYRVIVSIEKLKIWLFWRLSYPPFVQMSAEGFERLSPRTNGSGNSDVKFTRGAFFFNSELHYLLLLSDSLSLWWLPLQGFTRPGLESDRAGQCNLKDGSGINVFPDKNET